MLPERYFPSEQLIGLPAIEVVKEIFVSNCLRKSYLLRYHYEPGLPSATDPLFIPFDSILSLDSLIKQNLAPGYDIGIFSKVEMADGCVAHIPLIDFEIKLGSDNLTKIKTRLEKLPLNGGKSTWVILDSGTCYQAYCIDRFLPVEGDDTKTILRFAEKCHRVLDFTEERTHDEIVHSWWLLHSAVKGGMVLRLTRNRPELKKKVPEVVSFVVSQGDL